MQEKVVLIIDRDIITRKFLKQMLEKRGHRVLQAELGKEGLVFAWRDKPDVIVIDPLLPDMRGDLFIQKIRQDARTASTPVIALSSELSTEFEEMCLTQGYTRYYPKVGDAIPKFVSQLEGLEKTNISPLLEKRKGGKLIVLMSGKGGTGVSSIAANIAAITRRTKKNSKVALVDMVLPLGSLAPLVGYKESINITTLADLPTEEITPEFMSATLPHISGWRFSLLAGSPTPESASLLQSKKLPHLVNILREEFDYIFIDLGRSLSRISLNIIQEANLVCLIIGTDKESVRLTGILKDYLQGAGVDEKKLYPVLNRTVAVAGLTKPEAERIIGTDIKLTIPYMGAKLSIANDQAEPIIKKNPNDTATMVLIDLSKSILETVQMFKH